ncbi:MAG: hypothetical protein WCI73_05815 [Phycisphaerae bacterium]
MRIRLLLSVVILATFGVSGVSRAAEPLTWTVSNPIWDGEIYPSFVISMAKLKVNKHKITDKSLEREMILYLNIDDPFVFIKFNRREPGSTATVTTSCDAIMTPGIERDHTLAPMAGSIRPQDESNRLIPHVAVPMSFKFDALLANQQSKQENIDVLVSINGQPATKKTLTVTVRSINDCPFALEKHDLRWMFTAYVNEEHPVLDNILKEAIDTNVVDHFVGYQPGHKDKAGVQQQTKDQVRAIWTALTLRGMKYSNIVATPHAPGVIHSQHVRFVDESLTSDQANCVDGSVLFASVLQKIGIESELVHVPGHMFIRFDLDAQHKDKACLETTIIGFGSKPGMSRQQTLISASKSFDQAINVGADEWKKEVVDDKGEFKPGAFVLSISEARKRGITPIAHSEPVATTQPKPRK